MVQYSSMGSGTTYTQFQKLDEVRERLFSEFSYANVTLEIPSVDNGDTAVLFVTAWGDYMVKYALEYEVADQTFSVYFVDPNTTEHLLFHESDTDTLEMMIQNVVGLNPTPKKSKAQLAYEARKNIVSVVE